MYKLILFDFDGTLVHTAPDIFASANYVLKCLGYDEKPMDEVKKAIGHGVHDLMTFLMKIDRTVEKEEALLKKAVELFREHYSEHVVDATRPYPDVLDMLTGPLASIPKGIVTNKPQHLTEKILRGLEMEPFFERVIGTGGKFPPKPDAAGMLSIVENYGVPKDKTVFIGDSKVDYDTAIKAGVHFAMVNYGYDCFDPPSTIRRFSEPKEWGILVNGHV